jgi:hypothetical protein
MIVWRPVKDYENFYEVSNTGEVRSLERRSIDSLGRPYTKRSRLIKSRITKGYKEVRLSNFKGKRTPKSLHRLVACAFIPNVYNKPQVNHKDGNKLNNDSSNLEWVTASENIKHAYDIGLKSAKGVNNTSSKIDPDMVKEIRRLSKESGLSHKAIGELFGLSQAQTSAVIRGVYWSHVR